MRKGWKNGKKSFILTVLIFILFLQHFGVHKALADEQEKLPYLIKVNRYYNTVTIYGQNQEGEYTIPEKAMVCSVGTNNRTITGTFKTRNKYRWKELYGNVYGQYATRIVRGILFHSVYYYENENPATLASNEYNKLGEAASHGCIRLSVIDAKWIYDHCDIGTTVIIYDDKKTPGPLGKPEVAKIAASVRWDPTDPDEDNPYAVKEEPPDAPDVAEDTSSAHLPKLEGLKNIELAWGEKLDFRHGIKATSTRGEDITDRIEIEGAVDCYVPGKYKVAYSVEDETGLLKMKVITVTVQECPFDPMITGVADRMEKNTVTIDQEYALQGVGAFCENIQLDQKLIMVSIEKISETEYHITYELKLGKKHVTEKATVLLEKALT